MESMEMTEVATSVNPDQDRERTGKYLTFFLEDTEYGLAIQRVREIIGMMDITAVPQTPDCVRGVMNLRGKIIPVLDLRGVFGMTETADGSETRIIVVELSDVEVGIVVDAVHEVLDVSEEDVEDVPSFSMKVNTDFVLGMGKRDGRVTILLDMPKVLSQSVAASPGLNGAENAPLEIPHSLRN